MKRIIIFALTAVMLVLTGCSKLETLDYYTSTPVIKGLTADEKRQSYVIEISIGHTPKANKLRTDIINKTPRIQDYLRNFFSTHTAEDLLGHMLESPVLDENGDFIMIKGPEGETVQTKNEHVLLTPVFDDKGHLLRIGLKKPVKGGMVPKTEKSDLVPVFDEEGELVKIWNQVDKTWEPKYESALAQEIRILINKNILRRNYKSGIKEILFTQFQILPFLD